MGCCSRREIRVIRVADFEAGLRGLDEVMLQVFLSGRKDEEGIVAALLSGLRRSGNYIASAREEAYGEVLLREYRVFVGKAGATSNSGDPHPV